MAGYKYSEFLNKVLIASRESRIQLTEPIISYNLGNEDGFSVFINPNGLINVQESVFLFTGLIDGVTVESYDETENCIVVWFRSIE